MNWRQIDISLKAASVSLAMAIGSATSVLAGESVFVGAPEIDAAAGGAAIALLTSVALIAYRRFRQ